MPPKATIRDVARLANVSAGTVSNYLNDTKPISQATRERIESAIAKLNFVPNTAVRVMQGKPSHVIAFLVPDGGNPFFNEVARGIEDVAVDRGHVVVLCNTDGDPMREKHYARALSEMRVRAAIVISSPTSDRFQSELVPFGVRLITLGTSDLTGPGLTIPIDDRMGGRLAMAHVVELGHRRIGFLGGPGAEPQIRNRFAGALDALSAAGLDRESVVRVDGEGSSTAARSWAARQMLEISPRPTAVLCANDVIALALEAEAIRLGIRIPQELAIVGYDDIEGALSAPIPLTTIHQPGRALGRTAVELAFTEEPHAPPRFEPQLVVRESTVATTG